MAAVARGGHVGAMTITNALDHEVVRAARGIRPQIAAAREQTEANRCLAPGVVAAMTDAGLFRLAVARVDGGPEATPLATLAVYEELARVEASAAWIAWNNTLPALAARTLAPQVRRALFADARTITANSTRPSGRAAPCAEGFRVAGRWSLVSGCELAHTLLLRCVVLSPEGAAPAPGAPPAMVMAFVPRARCAIVDTWHVGGLRGTGSHDVVVDDVLVPASHTVSFVDAPRLDTPLHRMPFAATLAAGCAAVCLGIATSALDALLELARSKTPTDGGPALREQPAALARVARLTAQHAAARLLLHTAVDAAFGACVEGRAVTLLERAAIWEAAGHAASAARSVVREAYDAAGATAVYTASPLERAHRDVHVAAQHVILSELWQHDAGRVRLGLAPASPMFAS